MCGGETWYACVFQRFHDNHEQKNGLRHFFPITTSSLLKLANHARNMEVKLGTHVYFSVSMTTMNKKLPWALFLLHFSNLQTIVVKFVCKCISQHFHDELQPQALHIHSYYRYFYRGLPHTQCFTLSVYKNERRQVNKKFFELKNVEYRDGIKSKETRQG